MWLLQSVIFLDDGSTESDEDAHLLPFFLFSSQKNCSKPFHQSMRYISEHKVGFPKFQRNWFWLEESSFFSHSLYNLNSLFFYCQVETKS
mmetsp:Transcript_37822/g.47731  ORF Transcript_37822/g.47731 Transcript_37822/m.47731 type:complete len:90 (-) Transcript_37822:486-755(-)